MNELFGISMNSIMITLLVAFGLVIAVGVVIMLRNPVIFRLGVRNVPRRPAQTILIIIGLMLSTLIISAALTTGDTINHSITSEVYNIAGQTDELVVIASEDNDNAGPQVGVTFPQDVATDLSSRVSDSTVIDGAAGILQEPVPVINTRTNLSEPSLNLTGLNPTELEPFDGLKDLNGNTIDLATLDANEIVIGEDPADELGAQVGDTLTVFANNAPFDVVVAAIAPDSFLNGTTGTGQVGGFAMQLERAQEILGHPGEISYIAVTNVGGVEEGMKLSDDAVAELDAALEGTSYRAIAIKQTGVEVAEITGNIFTSIFVVMGLFSIAAGILLIFLIFVLLAAERKSELGMARAVGMKRRQLTQMFLAEGLTYDLFSALVGAALGVGVAFLIAVAMGQLFGDFLSISPMASWRSLVVAYTLGVIVTFITIMISSWRVSNLNIVAAIRDTPEDARSKRSRKSLIFAILGVIVGVLMMVSGSSSESLFLFTAGMSLVPLCLAIILRRVGLPARLVYTVAALLVLTLWLLPEAQFEKIFGSMSGGMEMFFVSGIMMVAAATVAIIWNAELLTRLVGVLGRAFSRWQPAVKTAVAYPLASKGRTGMTIAMFSLIVFSLVMMATINANFTEIFTTDEADAGWDIQATQAPNNPIDDFNQVLADNGVDTSQIAATGRVLSSPSFSTEVRMPGDDDWKTYNVNGAGPDFINHVEAPMQVRAEGYDSDEAVWQAVLNNPDFAVIDGFAIFNQGFGGDPNQFRLEGVTQGDTTMQPTQIEIQNPSTGEARTVTVIGVLDTSVSTLFGVYTSETTFDDIFEQPSSIMYWVALQPGVNAKTFAQSIESSLITYGVQAESIQEFLDEQSSQSQSILYLIEGFMGLGLLVGIAALGVISFRSVVERRQQIGMLRAIGYQRGMVAASFLIESSMITLLGVLSGGALGLILAWQLMTGEEFSGSTTSSAGFVIPWIEILAFLVISVGAALLMAYIPSRQAARVPIADALRYE